MTSIARYPTLATLIFISATITTIMAEDTDSPARTKINLHIQVNLVFTDTVNSVTDDCINTRVSVNFDNQKLNVSIDF